MQVCLRPHVFTGAAAIVGIGAVLAAPVVRPDVHRDVSQVFQSPAVALTALVNPLSEFMGSVDLVVNDLFDGTETYEPYNMYQGMVPEFIYDALPVISQMGYNGSFYLDTALYDLFTAPTSTLVSAGDLVWNLPGAVVTAAIQAITGNINGALSTLANAIVVPIQNAAASLFHAVETVFGGVLTNAANVLSVIPSLVGGLIQTTVGVGTTLFEAAAGVGSAILNAITSLNIEEAWNATIKGLLGPEGFPGVMELMTLGPGFGATWPTDYTPSFRVWGQGAIYAIANALGGGYPTAAAVAGGAVAAASSAAAQSAPPLEVASTEAADTDVPSADPSAATDNSNDTSPHNFGDAEPHEDTGSSAAAGSPKTRGSSGGESVGGERKTSPAGGENSDSQTERTDRGTAGKGHSARSARGDRSAA